MQNPPFELTPKILTLTTSISELIGELKAISVAKPSVKLRKENKIRTVHHSLAIEGNSLTEDQITAILENKKVVGPKNQITEVKNALEVYEVLGKFDPLKEKDLLRAHKLLMKNLVNNPGKYRTSQVGIFKGTKVSHMAPSHKMIPQLMQKLFEFLHQNKSTPWIIKACVFHYELEFIHPFEDGNGRMGRLWQQLLLMKQAPLFEYVSTESLIHKNQREYYNVLEKCDKAGDSTLFIEFNLRNIFQILQEFKKNSSLTRPKIGDRISYALEHFGNKVFTRKDYLELYKGISTATASRDLARAVKEKLLKKSGDKINTFYSSVL
ncbi:MAG: Fic family protein [Pseudobdellovibrionaceae bacterium]